jgi:chromosome segregation ATPase
VTQLRTFHESLVEAEIRLIEGKSEFNALEKENRHILEKQKGKLAEIQALDLRNTTLRKEYKRLSETTQEKLNSLSPEDKAIVLEYRQLSSLEALEQEVQAVAARLEMMVEGNSGIIKAFEKRKEAISRTREKITEIREQWEPELDALIAKISDAFAHNFQQIGCAGEVQVYKDEEDFDKWSIQISVRFR